MTTRTFNQPLGGNEMPRFGGPATMMRLPTQPTAEGLDACFVGIPMDIGTSNRPGTRFGPQGIRKISALYTPYNYELGVDLREQMNMCDAGDVFVIPANIEKTFDQISRGMGHIFASGALPIVLGGDHSIAIGTWSGVARFAGAPLGLLWIDAHLDSHTPETSYSGAIHGFNS